MTLQTVTVELPKPLYQRLWQKSQSQQRTIVEELYHYADTRSENTSSQNTQQGYEWLNMLSDDALWFAAQTFASEQDEERFQQLLDIRDEAGWNESQSQEARQLSDKFNQVMLIRSHAMSLLHQRGRDITSLISE